MYSRMSESDTVAARLDPRREGRSRLGDPNGNGTAETETWINFLREGSARSGQRRRNLEAGDFAQRASMQSRRASAGPSSGSASNRALLDNMGRLLSSQVKRACIQHSTTWLILKKGLPSPWGDQHGYNSPERPLPSLPEPRSQQDRDIMIPTWQPDSEVSDCPICGIEFGFWYRKHHCR